MAMSEEEILREAARIQASRRKRVAKTCQRCGRDFIGVAQAKYCSDACRMAAARDVPARPAPDPEHAYHIQIEPQLPGESIRDYWTRTFDRPLTDEDEEVMAALERIEAIRGRMKPSPENSLDIIHREREARIRQLTSQ